MLTIVGGKFRGRKIAAPSGESVRPTASKVRAAIFDVLQNVVTLSDMLALDLYAGSGALGLEALSRGADRAIFVEKSAKGFGILKKNINSFQLGQQAVAVHSPARAWLPSLAPIESPSLIFIDPPYHAQEYEKVLPIISQLPTILQQSILVIESPLSLQYPLEDNLRLIKSKRYGRSKLDFLVKC